MCDAMTAFNLLMVQVQAYKAFATSAMREAYNGKEVVELIKEKADINIEIIDGKGGGDYCFNRFASFVKTDETYLL
jgi:exopolyphosphatase/guanosine-5'-triphosphate,3'-diphosphate pyrophosphatase